MKVDSGVPLSTHSWQPILQTEKPGYRELVQALESDIRSGRLEPGQKLPTHRDLSAGLGISRGTVARAFDEAQRLGLVRSGIGQGTFVADAYVVRARQHQTSDLIEMGLGFPLYSLDPDPAPDLLELAADPRRFRLLRYPSPGGLPEQRHAGARWCRDLGVQVSAEHLFLTLGAQHAANLWLSLFEPGDVLLCAELTYRMVVAAAEAKGIRVQGVAMDAAGILPDELDSLAERTQAKGLFIMPTIQNPTTSVMPEQRRREVAEVVERRDLSVLEDGIHGYFLPAPRIPPLQAMVPDRVTYVASLSKILAGGLRVAFAVPPLSQQPTYRSALLTSVYSAPPLSVELAVRWIENGTAEKVVRAKRQEAATRLQRLHDALSPWVPTISMGAYYSWIALPDPWTASRFTMAARRHQVSVMPAEPFYVGEGKAPEAIRVSLGSVDPEQLTRGLEILVSLLRHPEGAQTFIV